ncbi:MAG: hypothetical protein PUD91_02390 [Bacteroidales bacterium]|nr:hypothetical protein [Bacteroidales bacterium]
MEDASIASDIYTLVVDNDIENGEIAVEGEEVQPQYQDVITYRFLRKGSPLKITVTPDFNYLLKALYVNGVNVIADVVAGRFTLLRSTERILPMNLPMRRAITPFSCIKTWDWW